MVEIIKPENYYKEPVEAKPQTCSCSIVFGDSRKKERTDFQNLMNHLGNLFWIFFILSLVFTQNVYLIWATLIAAIVFEEFD